MAFTKNVLTEGMSGGIGKQVVFKTYAYGTVATCYPDMSNVKPSAMQKRCRGRFLEAVRYARSILQDSVRRAELQERIGKGKSVYHAAIGEFMKGKKG